MRLRTTKGDSKQLRALLEQVSSTPLSDAELARISLAVAEQLQREVEADTSRSERGRRELLARLALDPPGQTFTTSLTDRAYRSQDEQRIVDVARQLLRTLGIPRYLPAPARAQLKVLLHAGPFVPELAARGLLHRLRSETREVVLDADLASVREHLARRYAEGVRVNLNYLGEAVLGERAAAARCDEYVALLARPEVRAISVKLSSIASSFDVLAWDETLADLAPRLRRIYRAALQNPYPGPGGAPTAKLVSLDMEAYRDLALTFELFCRLLDEPELLPLTACLVLQAYLPDAHGYQRELGDWARRRIARGGAPVRLRIVKGANLAAERVESALRGWALPMYGSKAEVDANFKRMLEYGAQPANARAVQVGIASHNVFDIALGLVLRAQHGVQAQLGFELLEGMADPLRRALQKVADDVLVYCPIVDASSMQTAIAYLMRRLDENLAPQNFLHQSFVMQVGDPRWQAEAGRFEQALAQRRDVSQIPNRQQDRRRESGHSPAPAGAAPARRASAVVAAAVSGLDEPFVNEPDTDFALTANRDWIQSILERWRTREPFELRTASGAPTTAGFDPSRPLTVPYRYALADERDIERTLVTAEAAAQSAATRRPAERAALLAAVAAGLRGARGELIAAMVLDSGKRVEQADVEVSEAIDFAEYYLRSYLENAAVPGIKLRPRGVVLVTPPWNFPLAIPAGGVLAALVAGNAVILKPALETVLVAERLVEVCHRAGVPSELLQLLVCEDELGSRVIRDPRVSAVVLTGATSTARLFHRLRPGLRLMAETGGKNSVIVSAAADRDAAIKDVLASAFGHAGQKCSAASLLICEAEVYDDPQFREVLADATASLPVGSAWDLRSVVTPLIAPASGPLARALRQLDEPERWLVAPKVGPDNPRLVSPGVKLDVAAGSFSHVTELFGPVLSVLRARDLDHALELANATPYGLTAGLFSLDEREQLRWSERMLAGNLYINRGVTGAVVRRQPFGGCKASSFGPGAKAGGPSYVLQLSRIEPQDQPEAHTPPAPDAAQLLVHIRRRLEAGDAGQLARAACAYAEAFQLHFARAVDPSALPGELNLLRHRPCRGLLIRASPDAVIGEVLLACVAGLTAGAELTLSMHPDFVGPHAWLTTLPLIACVVEAVDGVMPRLPALERIRQLGTPEPELAESAAESGVHVATDPILTAGRVELLHYLREQTLTVVTHRHGTLPATPLTPF